MKKDIFKRTLAKFALGACVLMAPCCVTAAEDAPVDECAKDYLLSYFPAPIVKETLKRFNVPQDKWEGIMKSLASKDKEVVKTVEQKAAAMNPNPLKDPQQRQAAVKLFRDTLMQVFSDAMKENNMTDTAKFQAMLDSIQQEKAKQFSMCMDKQRKKAEDLDKSVNEGGNAPNVDEDMDDESDEDDNDNSDEEDEDEDDMEEEESNAKPNGNANVAPVKK